MFTYCHSHKFTYRRSHSFADQPNEITNSFPFVAPHVTPDRANSDSVVDSIRRPHISAFGCAYSGSNFEAYKYSHVSPDFSTDDSTFISAVDFTLGDPVSPTLCSYAIPLGES
jgi:hypothetical protein